MEAEILILKIELKCLFIPTIIEHLCRTGYNQTGNKFSLNFNGSKGYLDHISIECEGIQKENNRIDRNELFTKERSVKKKDVNVFWSQTNGVRISFGKDIAKNLKS